MAESLCRIWLDVLLEPLRELGHDVHGIEDGGDGVVCAQGVVGIAQDGGCVLPLNNPLGDKAIQQLGQNGGSGQSHAVRRVP